MKKYRISCKRITVGSIILICGTAQLAIGTVFLLTSNTVARSGSNIWSGLVNVILGAILISPFYKRRVLIGIFSGTVLLNVVNLLLLEFLDWKVFTGQSDNLTEQFQNDTIQIYSTVYLVTTIPSVTVLIVVLLICQYLCCTFVMKKIKYSSKQENRSSTAIGDSIHFNWVFKEAGSWESEAICKGTNLFDDNQNFNENGLMIKTHKETSFIVNSSNVSTLALDDEIPTTFRTLNKKMPLIFKGKSPFTRYDVNKSASNTWTPRKSSYCNRHLLYNTDSKFFDSPPFIPRKTRVQRSVSEIGHRPSTRLLNYDVKRHSTTYPVPTRSAQSSPPRPFDHDSLISLKRLELLARQWRFQAQHRALRRQFSFQITQQVRNSTNL